MEEQNHSSEAGKELSTEPTESPRPALVSFTPAPWKVEVGADHRDVIITEQSGNTVCEPNTWDTNDWADLDPSVRHISRDEAMANASLIAAAPTLYEALKEARQMIFDLRGRAFVGSHVPRSQEPLLVGGAKLDVQIDAALALATKPVTSEQKG